MLPCLCAYLVLPAFSARDAIESRSGGRKEGRKRNVDVELDGTAPLLSVILVISRSCSHAKVKCACPLSEVPMQPFRCMQNLASSKNSERGNDMYCRAAGAESLMLNAHDPLHPLMSRTEDVHVTEPWQGPGLSVSRLGQALAHYLNIHSSNPLSSSAHLPHTNPTPLREHPRRNVHASQLLKQQLRRIRNVHLRDARLVTTRPAFELVLLERSAARHN